MVKEKQNLIIKCLIAFVLQILSFIFKPFIFLELIYLIFLISWDKIENKIYYLFFMLPFYNVFRYSAGATTVDSAFTNLSTIYLSLVLMFCFCLVMFIHYIIDINKKNKSLSIKRLLLWLAFYVLLIIPIRNFNLNTISSFLVISGLFVSLYLIVQYKDRWNLKTILDIWFIALILSVFTYCLKGVLPHLNEYLEQARTFLIVERRFSVLAQDPNYFAFEVLAVLCGYTTLFFKQQIKLSYIAYFVVLSILAILTLSKSFLISYAVLLLILLGYFVIFIINKVKTGKMNKGILFGVLALILGAVILFVCNIDKLFNLLFSQRNNVVNKDAKNMYELLNSLTTGRVAIWVKYLGYFFSSFSMVIWGRGALSGYQYHAVHNSVLQVLYFGGTLFFLMLLALTFVLFKKYRNQTEFSNYITIIVLFIFACSLDLLLSYRTYLILTVCILCTTIPKQKKEKLMEIKHKPSNEDFKEETILSIIIPAYNTQKYLDRCIKSICEQELIKTEVIIVDDGSTDNTSKIADRLAKKYDAVTAYHKENGGLSDARNYGINKSNGKYLLFVDSDDYVENNFTDIYYYLNENTDIIFTGYIAEYLKQTKIISYNKNKIYTGNREVVKNCLSCRARFNSSCIKIIRREFLVSNKLYFENGFAEDFNWLGRAICYVQSAQLTDLVYYHYIAEHGGSIMNTYNKKRFYDLLEHSKSIIKEIEKSNIDKKSARKIKEFIGFNIISNFRNAKYLDKKNQCESYKLLKDNYYLIKYQKPFIMKAFVIFGRIFGFEFAFKLAKFVM